jgi:hypothetical protein
MDTGALMLSGVDLPGSRDPLGLWTLEPPEATTFAAQERGEPSLVWRIRLPDSDREADRMLEAGLRMVSEKQAALRTLEAAFPRMTPTDGWRPEEASADAALWKGIVLVQTTMSAFPIAQAQGAALGGLVERGQDLLRRFRRLLTHLAWVETERSGSIIGITQVDWHGDFETTWGPDLTDESMALHLKAVRLALASRLALLRLMAVVVGGALALVARASVPGGQILLIPVVYGYVRDILEAWERIRDAVETG